MGSIDCAAGSLGTKLALTKLALTKLVMTKLDVNWRGGIASIAVAAGIGLAWTGVALAASALSDEPKPLGAHGTIARGFCGKPISRRG